MAWGSYCQEESNICIAIASCSCLAIIDSIRILLTLASSYRQTLDKKVILKAKLMWNFTLKLMWSFSLLCLSGVQIAMLIQKNQVNESFIFLQIYGVNAFCNLLWIICLTHERSKKGFTSKSTRISVIVNFISNAMIAILNYRNSMDSKEDLSFYLFVGYIGATGLFQIILHASFKDYNFISTINSLEEETALLAEDEEGNIMKEKGKADTFITTKVGSVVEEKSEADEKYTNCKHIKIEESNDLINIFQSKSQSNSQEQDNSMECIITENNNLPNEAQRYSLDEIQNIRIDKFEDVFKYAKKTIVYEIKFTYKGRMRSVKHSFREFGTLNNSLKQKYPELMKQLTFPVKKDQNSTLNFNDLDERRKQLSIYLQDLNTSCQSNELLDFLMQEDTKIEEPPKSPRKRQFKQRENSVGTQISKTVPEIIWEDEEEQALSERSH